MMALPARNEPDCKVLTIRLKPRKAAWLMGAAAAFLLGADLLGVLSKYLWNDDYMHGLVPLFDLDRERNIPIS
jgi:hypothetical protein